MSIRYTDIPSSMQVLGGLYNEPELFDNEKYLFSIEDFTEGFHRTLFVAFNNLYENGVKVLSPIEVKQYFESRPKQLAEYEVNNGDEYLKKLREDAQLSSFNYYYDRMKKFTLFRAYNEMAGMNLSSLYDINNILDVKKKQRQEDWLDNTAIEDIADLIDKKVEEIKLKYVNNANNDFEQAGKGAMALIEQLEETPEIGYPMYGKYINTIFRGARLGKFYLRSAPTGIGKAIPNNTLIPTPIGWRRVGDIKEGDYLFGQDGKPTKVLKIHPQPNKKQVWKVKFLDGRVAECCEDHLWEYEYQTHRGKAYRVESLKQIVERVSKLKNGLRNSDNKGYRFAVRVNEPIEYGKKEYSVPPYVMGALLGDGSFRYRKDHKQLEFSSADEELPNRIAKLLNVTAIKNKGENYTYSFKTETENNHNKLWVEELLKEYPELWNLMSEDKFIPRDYLEGSIEQRYELLQGLMDTDGSIDKEKGRISYTTISQKLRDDFIELVRSLGMTATYLVDQRNDRKNVCYNIHIQAKKEAKLKMFKLSQKIERAKLYVNNNKRAERKETNAIIDIQPTERYEDMTCFTVDNENHLFLMNDFIVTHNTRSMIADICNFGCDTLYDINSNSWVTNGTSESCLYIATEQDLTEVQTLMLAFIANIDEEHILYGKYEGDEKERVIKAAMILENSNIYVKYLPDFSMKDVEGAVKMAIREFGTKYICFDYIHSSMKILGEVSKSTGVKSLREDNILFMLGAKLKDICVQYGVFILSATQVNGGYVDAKVYDQNLLRGAKSLGDRIDGGMIYLPVEQEELEKLQPIIEKFGFETPTIKLSIYKNRRGRWKDILVWCSDHRGSCRIDPIFVTDYSFNLIQMEDINITVKPRTLKDF